MSWDPNQDQGQGQPGSGGQGQPGSGGPEPYSGYGAPQQGPYGTPPPQQGPYGTPPPQNPYGAPPPQQGPYGAPPPQYGAPPYQQGGYPYAPPQQAVRPVGQSIQELPKQYINVLTHPSDQTFEVEMVKADWPMIWVQLGILIVVGVVLGLIASLIAGAIVRATTGSMSAATAFSAFSVATTIGGAFLNIIFIPLFFFAGVGIQYLLAKAFNGQGTYMTQAYTHLLYKTPLDIASAILGTILVFVPFAGGVIGLAFFIYAVVLNVFQIKAVHRITTGRAAAVVLIPYAVAVLLFILCAVAFAAIFVSILNAGGRQ